MSGLGYVRLSVSVSDAGHLRGSVVAAQLPNGVGNIDTYVKLQLRSKGDKDVKGSKLKLKPTSADSAGGILHFDAPFEYDVGSILSGGTLVVTLHAGGRRSKQHGGFALPVEKLVQTKQYISGWFALLSEGEAREQHRFCGAGELPDPGTSASCWTAASTVVAAATASARSASSTRPVSAAPAPPDVQPQPTKCNEDCVGRYKYTASSEDQLSFEAGDVIRVTEKRPSGWWAGHTAGRSGWFPATYVSSSNIVVVVQKTESMPIESDLSTAGAARPQQTPTGTAEHDVSRQQLSTAPEGPSAVSSPIRNARVAKVKDGGSDDTAEVADDSEVESDLEQGIPSNFANESKVVSRDSESAYAASIKRLTERCQVHLEKNTELVQQVGRLEADAKDAIERATAAEERCTELTTDREALQAEHRVKLTAMECERDVARGEVGVLESELKTLKARVAELQAGKVELQKGQVELASKTAAGNTDDAELRAENDSLQAALASLKEQYLASAKSHQAAVVEQVERSQTESAQLREETASARAEAKQLQSRLTEAERALERLRAVREEENATALAGAAARAEAAEAAAAGARKRAEAMDATVSEIRARAEAAENELATLRAEQRAALAVAEAERESSSRGSEQLQNTVAALEAKNQALNELLKIRGAEVAEQQGRADKLNDKLTVVTEQLEAERAGRAAAEEREGALRTSLAAQRQEMDVVLRTSKNTQDDMEALRAKVANFDKVEDENKHLHAIIKLKDDADIREQLLAAEARHAALIRTLDGAGGATSVHIDQLAAKLLDRVAELERDNEGLLEHTQKLMQDLVVARSE